jgi:hypothetical protein
MKKTILPMKMMHRCIQPLFDEAPKASTFRIETLKHIPDALRHWSVQTTMPCNRRRLAHCMHRIFALTALLGSLPTISLADMNQFPNVIGTLPFTSTYKTGLVFNADGSLKLNTSAPDGDHNGDLSVDSWTQSDKKSHLNTYLLPNGIHLMRILSWPFHYT